MPKKITLGIDLGGTGIKLGLIEQGGGMHRSLRFSTPLKSNPTEVVELICLQARTLLRSKGSAVLVGAGMGAAGDIDPIAGVIRISPNLGWHNVPMKRLLEKHLHFPVRVENDANAAAWAAYVVESKRKIKNLVCVTVGTGIGGGLVFGGELYRGTTGSAGEIGHATLYPDGVPCACGNHGCIERYIGVRAMREAAQKAISAGQVTSVTKMVGNDLSKIDPYILQKAARSGDAYAKSLWDSAGEHLGIGLASIVNILNPEWIVLSGGLSRAGSLLLNPLRRTIRARSFATPAHQVKLIISKLDQDLGIVGAGLLAFESR